MKKLVYKTLLGILLPLAPLMAHSQCCDYTVQMNDTYGDGWNGASLDLMVNGSFIANISAQDNGSNFTFEVCNGDEIQLEYHSGDYENENSWYLLGGIGNLVYSDGPEPNVGLTDIIITDCDIEADPGSNPCFAIPFEEYGCLGADNSTAPGSSYSAPCANFNGSDIWYSIEIPESGSLIIHTEQTGNMNDTGLAIWQGENCNTLEIINCDDDAAADYFSLIAAYDLEPGSILYIQIWGYGGQTGYFDLCVNDPGPIDFESSVLPIFIIDTNEETIPDEPKIDASFQVIYNGPGEVNYLNGVPNEYDGMIGIETRGASSAGYPQKPYSFETRDSIGENNNVSLVEFPEENDWVLLSNYNDKTFIRNMLASHLYELMGNYSPRATLCEVMINGSYQGIYTFGEKIKPDDNRVDIAYLGPDENTGDDVTGGYILELNYWNNSNSWELNYSPLDHPDFDIHMTYRYPKPDVITDEQKDYIAMYVDSMETALYSPNFADPVSGYRAYLDVESFIDYFILNEVSRNNDGFKKSRYFFKDKASNGGKFKAGPPWDFDWAWKDLNSCDLFDNIDGSGWAHHINDCNTDNYSPGWYIRLLQDSTFNSHLRCRYNEYREEFLNMDYIENYVDSITDLVSEAQARHYQKWPFLGMATACPKVGPIPETYEGEMEFLKNWIDLRLNWLDDNLPSDCDGIPDDIGELSLDESIVFPNPSNGLFTIIQSQDFESISIYSLDGRLIEVIVFTGNSNEISFSIENPGTYICIARGNKNSISQKLIVQ